MSERTSALIRAITESPTIAITTRAKELRAEGRDVIGFGAGEPDFPTPAHVVAAAVEACGDAVMHRYSAGAGLPRLRQAIADKTARDSGLQVSPDRVVVANGGKHALHNAFTALLDPGDEVLLPAPYWVSYPEQITMTGATPVVVPTRVEDGFLLDLDALEAATTPRTTALVFTSPSNPTGAVHPPEAVAAIGRWAVERGLWVITDEIYEHLVFGDAQHVSMPVVVPELAERCIVVNGVAKTYAMTGWRVGWTIAPPDITAAINRLQSHTTSNVCNVAQAATIAALEGPLDEVGAMREAFDRRRRLMHEGLSAIDGVDCPLPDGAFYVFPSFEGVLGRTVGGRRVDSTLDLAAALLDAVEVAIVPGEAFGAPGGARLSYALGDDDLVRGVERIASALT